MLRVGHFGHRIFASVITFLVCTLLLLWGWNSSMPILFGLPRMQFTSALGLMILFGIVSLTIDRPRRNLKQSA
jgi:hypothetical protein